jgi:hypothetical protein
VNPRKANTTTDRNFVYTDENFPTTPYTRSIVYRIATLLSSCVTCTTWKRQYEYRMT